MFFYLLKSFKSRGKSLQIIYGIYVLCFFYGYRFVWFIYTNGYYNKYDNFRKKCLLIKIRLDQLFSIVRSIHQKFSYKDNENLKHIPRCLFVRHVSIIHCKKLEFIHVFQLTMILIYFSCTKIYIFSTLDRVGSKLPFVHSRLLWPILLIVVATVSCNLLFSITKYREEGLLLGDFTVCI